MTDAIVKKFVYYESARSVLIYHELKQFRDLQSQFFSLCASSFQLHEQLDLQDDGEQLHLQMHKKLSLSSDHVS